MWYHWLLLLAGFYIVGIAIYSIVKGSRSVTDIVMSAVQIAIGGGVAYYGYTGITAAPPTVTSAIPPVMMGGLRKLFRK